jgi:hypothetical protein
MGNKDDIEEYLLLRELNGLRMRRVVEQRIEEGCVCRHNIKLWISKILNCTEGFSRLL